MSINEELIDDSDRREAEIDSELWFIEQDQNKEYIEEQLDRQNDEIKDALAESYYDS